MLWGVARRAGQAPPPAAAAAAAAAGRLAKEVVVLRDPPVVHVFDVLEHGRRRYRRQVYTSDSSRSLFTPHHHRSEGGARAAR